MVSLDVKALFPSLPMVKALKILHNRLKNFKDLKYYTNLSVDEIIALVEVCVASPWFECERGIFLQQDGAPMGGPLSCLLADMFMEEYENSIDFKIESAQIDNDWLRFRDDTWFIWRYSLEALHSFIQYLNSIDPQIQWTYEVEKDNKINFPDVYVERKVDGTF